MGFDSKQFVIESTDWNWYYTTNDNNFFLQRAHWYFPPNNSTNFRSKLSHSIFNQTFRLFSPRNILSKIQNFFPSHSRTYSSPRISRRISSNSSTHVPLQILHWNRYPRETANYSLSNCPRMLYSIHNFVKRKRLVRGARFAFSIRASRAGTSSPVFTCNCKGSQVGNES